MAWGSSTGDAAAPIGVWVAEPAAIAPAALRTAEDVQASSR